MLPTFLMLLLLLLLILFHEQPLWWEGGLSWRALSCSYYRMPAGCDQTPLAFTPSPPFLRTPPLSYASCTILISHPLPLPPVLLSFLTSFSRPSRFISVLFGCCGVGFCGFGVGAGVGGDGVGDERWAPYMSKIYRKTFAFFSATQLLFLYFGFRMLKDGMESHGGPSEELTEVYTCNERSCPFGSTKSK